MKTQAAILVQTGQPLEIWELEIPALRPGQVLVQVAWSGVCHTQLLEARGYRGHDPYLPHCLGHEGSGQVLEVGAGVTKVKPGQNVILSWIKGTGADVPGTVYSSAGRSVNAGGVTTFGRHAVVSENRLTAVPSAVPLEDAAFLGCAVPTGLGSVFNTAQPRPGQSIAVFGCGGIGLCAVTGAAIAGCSPVVAVDINAAKLAVAREMGATHTIDSSRQDVAEALRAICPAGMDYAIEATGRPAVMQAALACVRSQGGRAVIIGNSRQGEKVELDPWQLNQGKQLLGTWGGDSVPDRDYQRYCRLLEGGRLDLQPLKSAPFSLEQVNEAMEFLERGTRVRPLIDMSLT